jgi:hypothetical protein
MYIIVLEKLTHTYHVIMVREKTLTDELRQWVFKHMKAKLNQEKTWLVIVDSFENPNGNRNCLDGYLTPACARCVDWMDGRDGRGCGCGSAYPISWCPAFAAFEKAENARRRWEFIVTNCNQCEEKKTCPHLNGGSVWHCQKI